MDPWLTSSQLFLFLTQLTSCHTGWSSVQCGPRSLACTRCHAPYFTICCVQVFIAAPLVQPCLEVPTLVIHICPVVPSASSNQGHIVQVWPKISFGSATLQHLPDQFNIYNMYSNGRSNSIMSTHLQHLPKTNMPNDEVVKCYQADFVVCKWLCAVGNLRAYCPWHLLRSMQPTSSGA